MRIMLRTHLFSRQWNTTPLFRHFGLRVLAVSALGGERPSSHSTSAVQFALVDDRLVEELHHRVDDALVDEHAGHAALGCEARMKGLRVGIRGQLTSGIAFHARHAEMACARQARDSEKSFIASPSILAAPVS